ncbi:MAG: molybdopterin synthase catalytic subunit [Lysobacterales bacterium]|jgi:molybdopterin synthase catalytic subunit
MIFTITDTRIDREALRTSLLNSSCGAFVMFEGWIRDHNEGQQVLQLEYEVYRPLACREGQQVLIEAVDKFDILDAACVHREGLLDLGETAVIAAAVAAHRDEAFSACRYIIDEVKHRLPIWKKEHYANGDAHWVNCQRCAAG